MEKEAKYINVVVSSTGMFSQPNDSSFLETECLFGETVKILEEYNDWFYCELLTDHYNGWINKKNLNYLKKSTHRIISQRSFIYLTNDIKSQCIQYLPMGAQLSVKNISKKWAEIYLSTKNYKTLFIPSNDIVENYDRVDDWVGIAEKCVEIPYRWGGRDTIGFDCSALLQLSYQTYGQLLPRNTSDQVKLNKKIIKNINELNRGCVVFWNGHVAIMVNEQLCVHANAFHMKTIIEPLHDIIKRIGIKNPIIKMMDFN